jgi:succinoglycan biosynthesis transport protein ExoP
MPNELEQFPVVYEQPYSPAAPAPSSFQPVEPESGAVPLSHYLWVIQRQTWKILAFVVICLMATYIISARLKPIYEGVATINIDRQSPSAVVGDDAKGGSGGSQDSDQYLATQIKIIQSDAVLRPVARRFRLLESEGQISGVPSPRAQIKEAAPTSLGRLKVIRPPNTFLILVTYRSPDPALAADVANAIARSYLAHIYRLQVESSSSAANFMEKQLDELKAKMERSGQALAQFERELNVINPEQKTSIISARLLQLNTEYTNAQADRVKKEAVFNALKSGALAAEQISGQGADLVRLQERINEAQERFAEVKASKGPNHPDFRRAQSQLVELMAQYQAARTDIGHRIELDYQEALNREQILQKTVAETKTEFDQLNYRSFDYQRLKEDADADKKLYQELITKIREAGINAGFENRDIAISDEARPPASPVFPNLRLNLLVAALLSALLAVSAVILIDSLDTTVRDPEQVHRLFNAELLGTIPLVKDPKALLSASEESSDSAILPISQNGSGVQERALSGYEEAVRMLRNSILIGDFDRHLRSILFTSAMPGEGKSTTALHLAMAHAAQGKKTLLIDADLRRPSLHRKLNVKADSGLSTVLTGEQPWREVVVSIIQSPNLDFIPSGPPSRRTADLVGSGVADLLEEVARVYDLVIIDAPPLLGFAEPMQLAIAADSVVVVAVAGETNRKAIAAVFQTLRQLRANVLGVILNRASKNTAGGYYYYQYGYNYQKYYSQQKHS